MTGSIAVAKKDELIGEVTVSVNTAHSERLMGSIDWLLHASGVSLDEISAYAVSIGPGSFTGLRIGLCTGKGLAFASGKPVIPVPTLDAFARTLPFSAYQICPMLDARKHEVYAALYVWQEGRSVKRMPERAVHPAELLREIREPTLFAGNGAIVYREMIRETLGENAIFAPPSRMAPSAATVAEVAFEMIRSGFSADPAYLTPRYLRKSEAEIQAEN